VKDISLPTLLVPLSWGEVIDKMTILEIKSGRLSGENALANVKAELSRLSEIAAPHLSKYPERLRQVNEALWDIEDAIRKKEAAGVFDDQFIELARSVYKRNDARAAIKREINLAVGSEFIEEKAYQRY
jgi:hypothetical protein